MADNGKNTMTIGTKIVISTDKASAKKAHTTLEQLEEKLLELQKSRDNERSKSKIGSLNVQIKAVEDAIKKEISLQKQLTDKIKAQNDKRTKNLNAHLNRMSALRKKRLDKIVQKEKEAQKKITAQEKAEEAKRNKMRGLFSKQRLAAVASTIAAYAGIGTAIYGTISAIKETVMEFLRLEKVMHQIKAITNATNEQIERFNTSIRTTAASISKSISDVSKYAVAMSKLGLSVSEIAQVTDSVATLSAVLGEDLAQTGTLVVTTLKQFNLEVEDAAYVTSVFFKAIKESPLDMNKLSIAMQYVGSSAEAVGVTFREAGDMMILLANRGLKASKIGTGLRNVFVKLKEDGVDVVEVLRNMNEAGLQFSEAVDLFGKRGAIVGYNLVANFKELEQMFKESLPTAMDNMVAKYEATSGFLDRMQRYFEYFKARFADKTAFDRIGDEIQQRQLFDYIKKLENGEQIFDKLNEFAKNGNKNGFFKLLSETFPEAGKNSSVFNKTLNSIYNNLNKIYGLQDEVRKGRKAAEEAITGGVGTDLYAGINMSPQSRAEQNKSIEQVEAILKNVESQRKTPSFLRQEDFKNKSDTYFRSMISSLEKNILKLQQMNATSFEESLELIRTNGEQAKNIIRSQAAALKWSEEKLEKELDAIDEILKREKKRICKNHPELDICKKSKGQKTRTNKDVLDFGSLSSGQPENLVPDIQGGDFTKRLEAAIIRVQGGGNINEIISELSTYYDEVLKKATDVYEQSMIDIDTERQRIDDEYYAAESDLSYRIANASDDESRKKYVSQLDRLSRDYGKALKNIEKQGIESTELYNKVKLKLYNDFIKASTKIRKEYEKVVEDDSKSEIEKEREKWQRILEIASDAIGALAYIYNKFAQENLNNRLEAIAAEIEAVQARKEVENDILKSQFDNNIITAEAYAKKREELEKKRIAEENRLNKAAFEAQKKSDIQSAIVNGVANAAQAFISTFVHQKAGLAGKGIAAAIASGIVLAKSAAEVAAINKRKFFPVKYAEGGEVIGRSHAAGGVPFTVQGQGGYEMEGGEYVVNKYSTEKYKPLLEAINNKPKAYSDSKFFANGGQVGTTQQDINMDFPKYIKAYITKRDMREYQMGEENIKQISKL
jgi:hypothetical protein